MTADTPDPRPVSPPSELTAVLAALDEAMGLTDDEEVAYQIAQARGPIAVLAARAAPQADAGLREAAQNIYNHIVGGMENGSHLPGDLCVRQLASALAAARAAREPSGLDFINDVTKYDERRREVAEMIEDADRQDDSPMGPDGLADALMEIALGWCRAALQSPPTTEETT